MASNISESSVPTSFYQLNFLAYHWLGGLPRTKDSEALKELINPRTWFPVEDYPDGGGARASTSNKVNFEHSFWKPEGVEVWQSTDKATGERSLLMNSAILKESLINLHRLGKTSSLLPLPPASTHVAVKQENEGLLTRRLILSHTSFVRLCRDIEKSNGALRSNQAVSVYRVEYENLRRAWSRACVSVSEPDGDSKAEGSSAPDAGGAFIAIDVETWEREHGRILEIGWSILSAPDDAVQSPGPEANAKQPSPFVQRSFHRVVLENRRNRNGRYVADNRDHFLFGSATDGEGTIRGTKEMKEAQIGKELRETIDNLCRGKGGRGEGQPVYMVFHDSKGDLPVLRDLGIDTSKWVHGIHLQTPHSYAGADVGGGPSRSSRPPKTARDAGQPGQVYIVDTQKLFAVLEGRTSVKVGTSLKRMCALLQVNGGKIERLHNAGNDAHYTLQALEMMASGPPLLDYQPVIAARAAAEPPKNAGKRHR